MNAFTGRYTMVTSGDIDAAGSLLRFALPHATQANVRLSEITRWRVGGIARIIVRPHHARDVQQALEICRRHDVPTAVVGDTSNILFADRGFAGVLIQIGREMSAIDVRPDGSVVVQAGAWVPGFVRRTVSAGLTGCTHAIGVPGTMGGLIAMNGGTQRKGIGENVRQVHAISLDGELLSFDREACDFSYRQSIFQRNGAIVLSAKLAFDRGHRSVLRREALATLVERNRKFPRKLPNCGSVFLSNPAMYAVVGPPGKAIENVGLKGHRIGGAQISPLHANFIVNTGSATAHDILALIRLAQTKVETVTRYRMACEVKYMTATGCLVPADKVSVAEE